MTTSGTFERIYAVVRRIPRGRVATYGQVALLALGRPNGGRTAGWALRVVREGSDVPWQRVVNAGGRIVTHGREDSAARQHRLLKEEGIVFEPDGRIDLARFGWDGR